MTRNLATPPGIDCGGRLFANLTSPVTTVPMCAMTPSAGFCVSLNPNPSARRRHGPGVSNLAARLRIERRAFDKNLDLIALGWQIQRLCRPCAGQ